MILAAGLGTRLRPLTDRVPKALVEVAGVPMLERVARRLVAAGVERIIINVHHHAPAIERFVEEREGFGVEVRISREEGDAPLDTGGGLLAAAPLFESSDPFILHNVDVISDLDLRAMWAAHQGSSPAALSTLATHGGETSRPLLADDSGVLGVANRHTGWRQVAREPVSEMREIGFIGVHVLSPEILPLIEERGAFSIIEAYMRLIAEGHRLATFDIGDAWWVDVGTRERLERARDRFEQDGPTQEGYGDS